MGKRAQQLHAGEVVEVTGHCGDEQGECKGMRGRVVGDQRSAQNVGPDKVHRTNVLMDDGTMVGVPTAALRKRGPK